MTDATPEQMDLARKIVKDHFGTDNGLAIKIALAAIIETTERAAKLADTRIIANAGRYDRAEALRIAGTRDGGWRLNKGNPDEIAIPERDAIDQYADITRSQNERGA